MGRFHQPQKNRGSAWRSPCWTFAELRVSLSLLVRVPDVSGGPANLALQPVRLVGVLRRAERQPDLSVRPPRVVTDVGRHALVLTDLRELIRGGCLRRAELHPVPAVDVDRRIA